MTVTIFGTDSSGASNTTIDNSPTLGNTSLAAGAATQTAVGFALTGNQAYLIAAPSITGFPFAVAALVKGEASKTDYRVIWSSRNTASGAYVEMAIYGAAGPPAYAGRLRTSIYDGTVQKHVWSTTSIDDNDVHHVVWWAASASDWRVLIDGVDESSYVDTFGASSSVTFPALPSLWSIGNYPSSSFGDDGFGGDIQHVNVYNVDTADELPTVERFAAHAEAALTAWSGDTGDQRIQHVVDAIGYTGDLDLDTSITEMSTSGYGGSALDYFLSVADTENSPLYIDGTGALVFIARSTYIAGTRHATSQGVFTDEPGGIGYTDVKKSYNNTNIRNRVAITRAGAAAPIIKRDEDSIAAYGLRSYERSVLSVDDIGAQNIALWILGHYKDVLVRIDQLTTMPRDAASWAQLGRMIGDRITVTQTPQDVGDAITKDVIIEGISCHIDATSVELTWELSLADVITYWVLGTATLAETTTLSY